MQPRLFDGNRKILVFLAVVTISLSNCSASYGQNLVQGTEAMDQTELNIDATEHFIDVGGRKLHCKVYGSGSPTIVLISGFGAPQSTWYPVIPDLAELSTVFTYDRPGYGQSEIGDAPNHGLQAARDLKMLLDKTAVPKPYLVVGHSYGCRVARLFASNFPDIVAGLILEDGQHEDILEAQKKVLSGKDLESLEQMAAQMAPPENPKSEFDYTLITAEQLRNSPPLPAVPYTLLTAGTRRGFAPPMLSAEGQQKFADTTWTMIEKLAAMIPDGKHVVVEGAGHFIHRDRPEALVDEIKAMMITIRESSSQ